MLTLPKRLTPWMIALGLTLTILSGCDDSAPQQDADAALRPPSGTPVTLTPIADCSAARRALLDALTNETVRVYQRSTFGPHPAIVEALEVQSTYLLNPYLSAASIPGIQDANGVNLAGVISGTQSANGASFANLAVSNGEVLFSIIDDTLRSSRVAGGQPLEHLDTLAFAGSLSFSSKLTLSGDRLVVASYLDAMSAASLAFPDDELLRLTIVDVSDPNALAIVSDLVIEGRALTTSVSSGDALFFPTTRRLSSDLWSAAQSALDEAQKTTPDPDLDEAAQEADLARAREVIQVHLTPVIETIDDDALVPRVAELDADGAPGPLEPIAPCSGLSAPPHQSAAGLVSVLRLTLADAQLDAPFTALGFGVTMHLTPERLYVAQHNGCSTRATSCTSAEGETATYLHAFQLTEARERPTHLGSTRLLGQLDALIDAGSDRVLALTRSPFHSTSERQGNLLFILDAKEEGSLETLGALNLVGKGPTDTFEGALLVGDALLVSLSTPTTAAGTDTSTLYPVDLNDPGAPEIGEGLDIGVDVDVLRRLGETRAIVVGHGRSNMQIDTLELGRRSTLERLATQPLPYSLMTRESSAMLWAPPLLFLPIHVSGEQLGTGYTALKIEAEEAQIEERARIDFEGFAAVFCEQRGQLCDPSDDAAPWRTQLRSVLLIGDQLITPNAAGVQRQTLDDLTTPDRLILLDEDSPLLD